MSHEELESNSRGGNDWKAATDSLLSRVGGSVLGERPCEARAWLVDGLLAAGDVCFLAGPKKSLKTSIAIDLAISVAAGVPFLDRFPSRSHPGGNSLNEDGSRMNGPGVVFFSGESSRQVIEDTASHVAVSKGLPRTPKNLILVPGVPHQVTISSKQLEREEVEEALERQAKEKPSASFTDSDFDEQRRIRRHEKEIEEIRAKIRPPEIRSIFPGADGLTLGRMIFSASQAPYNVALVIVDPLYLVLSSGESVNTADLVAMGGRLRALVEEAAGSLVIVHHSTKSMEPGKPMELADLSAAGCAEFARQWMLVNRRLPFNPADKDTMHRLYLNYGGSAGHSGLVAVDVDMGKLDDDGSTRKWAVKVSSVDEAKAVDDDAKKSKRESKQETARLERVAKQEAGRLDRVAKLLAILPANGDATPYTKARELANMNSRVWGETIAAAGEAVCVSSAPAGRGRVISRVVGGGRLPLPKESETTD